MLFEHISDLRDRAAEETLKRIRADCQRASQKIKPLLIYIGEHLFDLALDVNRLRRDLGIRNNSTSTRFHRDTGFPPKAYIIDCRMHIAARLLRESGLHIWRIAELVGYSSLPVFSHAFTRWAGIAPTQYRDQESIGNSPPPLDRWNSAPFLRRAIRGALALEDSAPLLLYLHSLYRPNPLDQAATGAKSSPTVSSKQPNSMDGAAYDLQRAREVWNRIQPWPAEEQRAYLGRSVSLGSPALFNLLRRMSREIGLHDRKRAVHIAELALQSVLGSRQHLSESFWDLKAQAWAWVANARRLARDRLGAEEALSAAEESWRQPRTSYDLMVEAEILAIKSCLRLLQGELEEAIDLLNRALPEFRRGGSSLLLGHFLIHRAILLIRVHEPEEAASTLVEVYELLEDNPQPSQLLLATLGDLARLLAHLGRRREAAATLRRAEALCGAVSEPFQRFRLAWAKGVLQVCMDEIDAAERIFISLREELAGLQSEGCLATVTLDLALLYQRQGRHDEIIPLVRSALPILDRFPYKKRALDSLTSLRRAVERGEISPHLLQEIHLLSLSNTL